MADEWEEEFSQYESSGKSFGGRGNYGTNDAADTAKVQTTTTTSQQNSGWEEDAWQEDSGSTAQNDRNGDSGKDYQSSFNGGGNRYGGDRGDRGGRGRGGRGGRGGNRGGGGFQRNDGDRDGGYKRDDDRDGGYKRDGQRNGFGGRSDKFGDGDNGDDRGSRGGGFRGGRGGRDGGDRDGFSRGGDRGGFGRGGRGGRGGGRDGGRDEENGWNNNRRSERNGDDNGDGDKNDKPREIYIPPEPTDNEDEIFNSGITSGINFDKYDKIPINVSSGAPPAISSFEESNLRQFVLDNVKKSGYTRPTPIQKNAIPIIMNNMDLMACAQTGSGKTAAFLLPIVHTLLEENKDVVVGRPHCFVISPTRELAIQIFNEARKFALGSYLKIQVVYGGTAVRHQGNNIARGCHVVVCTPGRLLDFVEKEMLSFEDVRFMVLDEADRMLDLGFMPAVEKVMNHPTMSPVEKRQTLMFSATFPEDIQRLAGKFLNNYAFLAIGIVGGACADVEQTFYELTKFEKRSKLTALLEESIGKGGIMVFVETKRNADYLASLLSETKFPTTSIHGDRLQREREEALADFKSGKMDVLIATSVAARGLDIKHVAHVINYDLPKSIDEYVHRIGRTGRVGNCGKATSFYDADQDAALAPDLVKILKQANQPVPDFLLTAGGGGGGGGYRSSKFGGRDVRRSKNVETNENMGRVAVTTEPDAHEPDEEW